MPDLTSSGENCRIHPKSAIVIPALNEEGAIANVVSKLLHVVETLYVVDDGSTDKTASIARHYGAVVVSNPSPTGYDAAIAKGINMAFKDGAKVVLTCDADGQHRLEDICRILDTLILNNLDFCGGVRDHYNRPIEGVVGFFSRFMFGTKDPFCGLKAYKYTIFEKVVEFPEDMHIGTLPYIWNLHYQFAYQFIPIHVKKRQDHPRFGTFVKANIWLAKAFFKTTVDWVKLKIF